MNSFKFKTPFATSVFNNKYNHDACNTWPNLARVLVNDVTGDRSLCNKPTTSPLMSQGDQDQLVEHITKMQFIPAGRYLYYSGRPISFYNNCFCLRAEEDTREEWGNIVKRASDCLMSGGGIGVDYSRLRPSGRTLSRTGGISSGPLPLMSSVNEIGRNVMQGGSRRSAIYASLNWQHEDIEAFLNAKDWSDTIKKLKAEDFNFPAAFDMTNMSINWDTKFIEQATGNGIENNSIPDLWYKSVRNMCETGEPGHSYNFWENENDTLRNACQPAFATVLTPSGISEIGNIKVGDLIWSGCKFTPVVKKWYTGNKSVYKYNTTAGVFIGTDNHKIFQNGERTTVSEASAIDSVCGRNESALMAVQDIVDGLVIGDGSVHKASNNLVYLCVGSKDVDYFNDPIKDLFIKSRGGLSKGAWQVSTTITAMELPKTYLRTVPDRFFYGSACTVQGFLRGLFSANGSISGDRVTLKQTSHELIRQVQMMLSSIGISSYVTTNKAKNNIFPNGTYQMKESYDINITRDRATFRDKIGFIQKYKQQKLEELCSYMSSKVSKTTYDITSVEYVGDFDVFDIMVEAEEHSYWTGGLLVSNCTEFTSEDDSDVCNLGSINFGNISSLDELKSVVNLASKFLVCGSIRGDLPYDKVKQVREQNRKIGLGLMGVHEWLLQRGMPYEVNDELKSWLQVWKDESERSANEWSDRFFINRPKKYRAVAPAGTIGILASTTGGIEPLFAVAYKRRYLEGGTKWKYQYVVDSTAQHLVDTYGINPDEIETSSSLAADPERRIRFQYEIQKYVDMAISSTINLPEWGSDLNNEDTSNTLANTLLKYCHGLRGITVYPNGSRGGQPLTSVSYEEAKKHHGIVYAEENTCSGGICSV